MWGEPGRRALIVNRQCVNRAGVGVEGDLGAVGRPRGVHLQRFARGELDDVGAVGARGEEVRGREGVAVVLRPHERHPLPVGRPRGAVAPTKACQARAVGVHHKQVPANHLKGALPGVWRTRRIDDALRAEVARAAAVGAEHDEPGGGMLSVDRACFLPGLYARKARRESLRLVVGDQHHGAVRPPAGERRHTCAVVGERACLRGCQVEDLHGIRATRSFEAGDPSHDRVAGGRPCSGKAGACFRRDLLRRGPISVRYP